MEVEAEIDGLPIDPLVHILVMITSFTDLAKASSVCQKWKQGVKQSLARRETLSFAGWKMDDDSTARLVRHACSFKEFDISSSRRVCQVCEQLDINFLMGYDRDHRQRCHSIDSRANSLQHPNVGCTFITDESLQAIADCCPLLKASSL